MSGDEVSLASVQPRRAARKGSRYWVRLNDRLDRAARKQAEQAPGPIPLRGHDPVGLVDTHIAGARHTLEGAKGALVFGQIDTAW